MIRKIFILIVILILSTACGTKNELKPVEKQEFHMGTVVTARVYGDNANKAIDEVMGRITQLENMMTINAPGSEIDRLNSNSGSSSVKLSKESLYVIKTATKFASLSNGAFDITVGPLVKAWGIFTDHPTVPTQNKINNLLKLVNYKDIDIDENNMTGRLVNTGESIDLGGIAKGYAGDEAISIYKKYGIKSAYINLGGNVVVLGNKPDGTKWKIGVQNPRAANGAYIGILSISDKAIVTSGDYERFFEKDNKRYHHILDPKTGYPADSGLIGISIIADKSIDADALSTSAFVLGLENGMKLIESLKGVEAVFITADKKVYITSGLKNVFSFADESKEFTYVEKR